MPRKRLSIERSLLATAALLFGFHPALSAARLEILLTPEPSLSRVPVQVELSLHGIEPKRDPVHRLVNGTSSPQAVDLDEGTWVLETRAEGVWAPARTVTLKNGDDRRVEVGLFDAALVRGRVEVERGAGLPSEMTAELYPPVEVPNASNPRPRQAPPAEALVLRCPVVEGSFECAAPAGEWDARFRVSGHISHYFWKVRFSRESPASLGTLRLRRGASVVGWIRAEGIVPQGRVCKLSLEPMSANASASNETLARALSLYTVADERGFFHFAEIAPGAYTLTATLEGFAPARFFPVRVFEDRESQLQDPLVLLPPLLLEVRVDPPRDLQQRPWKIEVFDLGNTPGSMKRLTEGSVGEDGTWSVADLSSGRILAHVVDGDGTVWSFQEMDLSPSATQLDFALDLVEVEGTLHLGSEPLAADLYFGGKMGVPSLRLTSDPEGRFQGYLPREGPWRIEVEGQERKVHRFLQEIEVRRSPGKRLARLAIELPGGRLQGQVVDEAGEPVPEARVMAGMVGERPAVLRADREGAFEALGFGEGQAVVQALGKGMESEKEWLQLGKSEAPPLRLVVKKKKDVTGWVLSPSGGVPGAKVLAMAPGQIQTEAVTDLSGRFSLRVPAAASTLDVVVLPPGYSLQVRRLPLAEGDLRLFVEAEGGTLILEDLEDSDQTSALVLLAQNGTPLDPFNLKDWSESNGQRWASTGDRVTPQVEAGFYEACRVPFSQLAARLRGDRSAGRCANGILSAGGTLRLKIPGD